MAFMLTEEAQPSGMVGHWRSSCLCRNEFRQYDEHGFPVAPRFEELTRHDDEPPRRPGFSVRTKRIVVVGLIIGVIVPIVFGPRLMSFGRELAAQWYSSRAQKKFWDHDMVGAVRELSCAIEWCPHDFELRWQCAVWRADQNDLPGSIEDHTECIRLAESATKLPLAERQVFDFSRDVVSMLYADRGWIYVRMGKSREALDDVNKAVELHPTAENLNTRAYARAVLNIELNEGLADIDKALKENGETDAEMLDTRGYLKHLLNNNEEALADLDQAIKLVNDVFPDPLTTVYPDAHSKARVSHNLAVMYHHRSEILQQLGKTTQARDDRNHGDRLGYNPDKGVL